MNSIKVNIFGNTMEMSGDDLYSAEKVLGGFYDAVKNPQGIRIDLSGCDKPPQLIPMNFTMEPDKPREEVLKHEPDIEPGIEHDIVAIYDNAGIPSIMRRFRKTTNKELFGGSDKAHSAFIIGGEEYDEIYISVYKNCEINGKPYSLPMQKPWTNITQDAAAKACFSKGDGWHLLTAPEWGLIANLCVKAGVFPHGNTDRGKYHADAKEKGVKYDDYRTLTGSGPSTWTHDHTPYGLHDMCGNVLEMVRGSRIKDGRLEVAKDNDAALDIDLTQEGDGWQTVKDDNGNVVTFTVDDEDNIKIGANEDRDGGYTGSPWKDVDTDCKSEQLKELALYAGEPDTYCYVDTTDGEYMQLRGGHWNNGSSAGVFLSNFDDARSLSYHIYGFRSAFFRKTGN